ncbi:putative short-chain dehydrogenases/reductase [Annulohypoxylon nitens]|nr:putative short-chain dehydrogenases/reductase [Annulohypoxylon nitens]
MVALSTVEASNASIGKSLPDGMVGVFVGATSGIGEYTLKAFAQRVKNPRAYIIGRSQAAADRIIPECKQINPTGQYTFIRADVSLLNNVDNVCQQILAKEDTINLLFQTQGTMLTDNTAEGLSYIYVLPVTSRILFALNLLPAIQKAKGLKRVVSVFASGYEGPYDENQWAEFAVKKPMKARSHISSMITMANNVMARQAPDVSFVHNYPGAVQTPFGKDAKGMMAIARTIFNFIGRFLITYLPPEECGALQLYCATSSRFPPAAGEAAGVPVSGDVTVSRGTDGQAGSGSYTINYDNENVSTTIDEHLAKAKADGVEERMWAHILEEIKRVTGKAR